MRLIRCSLIEKLLLLWLFLLQAAVVASTKLLGELVDPSGRVNKLQFAGVERVTVIANIDPQLGLYATSLKRIAATTSNGCVLVIRVDSLFHRSSHLSWGDSGWLKYSLPGHEYYAKSGVLDKAHERIYVKSVNKAILVSLQWEDRAIG